MGISVDRLKKYLLEISDAVNAFDSESVQVKVISHLIAAFPDDDNLIIENRAVATMVAPPPPIVNIFVPLVKKATTRKTGLTKFIKEEISGDYFQTARTLAGITDYFAIKYETKFYTYQTSGILLVLVRKGKLRREIDPIAGGYLYMLPTE